LTLPVPLLVPPLGRSYDMQSPWCLIGGPYGPKGAAYMFFYGPSLIVRLESRERRRVTHAI
jgi:hypothetical protein